MKINMSLILDFYYNNNFEKFFLFFISLLYSVMYCFQELQ